MGYVTGTGICMGCKRLFCFHLNDVLSLNGQPICKECIDRANLMRKKMGSPLITYTDDAYQTGQDEEEIDWDG